MPTLNEYASLSAHVYNDQRGGGPRAGTNKLDLPLGWQQLSRLGFDVGPNLNVNPFSFTAEAYINGAGEIVIAYKGTDFLTQLEGRAWNTVADLAADVGLATASASLNVPQQLYAASYYAAVKDWAVSTGHDPAKISFTGHSLGGGLASNMAVWFDKKATVFAEGPFEIGALNRLAMTAAIATLTLQAATSGSLAILEEINRLREMVPPEFLTQEFARREPNVTNYANEGEFLGYLRALLPTVVGNNQDFVIPLGFQPIFERALDLHSMNLHAAFLFDDRFRQQAVDMPELIPALLDKTLRTADPNFATEDLVTRLVNDQLRQGFDNDSALKRFSADLQMLRLPGGAAGRPFMQTALIAAVMDYYALKSPEETSALLSVQGGSVHFDYKDIGGQYFKSLPRLRTALFELAGSLDEIAQMNRRIAAADSWHVQKGSGTMNWTADVLANDGAVGGSQADELHGGGGDDLLIGQDGTDTLAGDGGADTLFGGEGADRLSGGAGSDYLMGGAGVDIYAFEDAFGVDVIEEDDAGQGLIQVSGLGDLAGSGATKVSETIGVWQTEDKSVTYTLSGAEPSGSARQDLLIRVEHGSTVGTIAIRNWINGRLGITLEENASPPASTTTFTGDFEKTLDPTHVDQYQFDGINYARGNVQAADDLLTGTLAADHLLGLAGNDGLSGAGGDDVIEGGDGDDLLFGGTGSDHIDGGDGIDFIYGSGLGALSYPLRTTDEPPVADGTEYTRGFSWVTYDAGTDANDLPVYGLRGAIDFTLEDDDGNIIDAGEGGDWVRAGSGDDVVHGGAGIDNIHGLAGDDVLYGDEGDDVMVGDGVALENYIETVLGDDQGRDILVGGAGNDNLSGQGGDDEVYGGDDDDQLWGDDDDERYTPSVNHGTDYLDGGNGNDLVVGGGRDDTLFGGIGNDTLVGDDAPDLLAGEFHGDDFLDGEEGADQLDGGGGADTLIGGTGNDILYGDDPRLSESFAGDDYLDGGDGNDQLSGGGANDVLEGGAGDDLLVGDAGDDLLYGDAGADQLAGGDGDDELDGGDAADILVGDAGNDTLFGGAGADAMAGSDGNDRLDGDDGDDELQGGDGNDVLSGGLGADKLFGQAGDDQLQGGDGNDQLAGGDGNDMVVGGVGEDALWGDAGDDTLDGGIDNDQLAGGVGNDQLGGGSGDDVLFGEDGNDVLDGGNGIDALWGDAGNDRLDGGDANDQLVGGSGDDVLNAGTGNDTLFGEDGADALDGGDGDDTLVGGAGNDTLNGGAGIDRLFGGDGDDTYVLSIGDNGSLALADSIIDTVGINHLRFGSGLTIANTTLSYEQTTGQPLLQFGSDFVVASGLLSGSFADVTFADGSVYAWQAFVGNTLSFPMSQSTSTSGSQLVGGRLDDTLSGSGGGSTFWGGVGNDTITGNGGQNTYVFNRGDGHDTINELSKAVPTSTVKFGAGIAPTDLRLGYAGNQLRIAVGDGTADELTLLGFSASNALASIGIAGFAFADGSSISFANLLTQRGFTITGSNADDILLGTSVADVLDGGAGNDTLSGRQGSDTYRFGRGSGADTAADQDTQGGTGDRLLLGTGIAVEDLIASRYRTDLNLTLVDGSGSVRLKDYYIAGAADAIELIEMADGMQLSRAAIDALVQQHAGGPIIGGPGDDVLYGTAGADSMTGGAGADLLYADSGDDTLTGGTGNDAMYGEAGSDTYVIGLQAGTDTIDETAGGDAATVDTVRFVDGIRRSDVTFSTAGNNLVATAGALGFSVSIQGQFVANGSANQIERFVFDDGTVLLAEAVKDEALSGSPLSELISGFATDDTVAAGYGNDYVYGRGGADVLRGGEGADTLDGETGDDSLFGDAGDDLLYGADGNDRLEGGTGRDRLDGGTGNDTYAFGPGQGNDIVVQDIGGLDSVVLASGVATSAVSLHRVSAPTAADLAFNGDSLVIQLAGSADQLWIANYFAGASPGYIETIRFADGTSWDYAAVTARLATPGGTVNTQTGTNKANTFVVDHWNDVISNPSPTAGDKISASVSYRVPVTTTDLTLTGTLNLFAVGTTGVDTLRGNDGGNLFEVIDDSFGDAIAGGKGDDVYRLRASSENPTTGADPSSIVRTAITELAAEGNDTLESAYWSAQLPTNVENLLALASNNVATIAIDSWKENDLAHKFVGNALANRIDATAYEESALSQWWYSRRNFGGMSSIGTYRLDGGAGADTLIGGWGNDTYVIDNAGDVVIETGVYKGGQDASVDTVETPFETVLASAYVNIENVTLTGTAGVGANGSSAANRLDGSLNAAVNRLAGGLGNDTYVVGIGDIVVEGADEGIDTLVVAASASTTVRLSDHPNVENLRLAAASGALDAEGTAAANVMQGSLGNNRLSGGDGNDTISDQALADIAMYGGRVAVGDRDWLDGGSGDDLLTSYGGDDTFDGGSGDDRIVVNGQTGTFGSTTASAVTIRFGLGDGHDMVQRVSTALNRYTIELKAGADLSNVRLRAIDDALVVELADGSSLSFASAVSTGSPPTLAPDLSISLAFADGLVFDLSQIQTLLSTTFSTTPTTGADFLIGTANADTIDALAGDDMVAAGGGDDRVDGGDGADRLFGDAGNDLLFGNAGTDTLTGGAGNDLLAGGSGADTYRFGRNFGQDSIDDRLSGPASVGVDDASVDTVEFDSGIAPSEVAVYLKVEGTTTTGLMLGMPATGDSVELRNAHQQLPGAIENVRFADGTQWDRSALSARLAGSIGSESDDTLNATVLAGLFRGFGGADLLTGGALADTLDGGTGADRMSGGAGDDTYYVDNAGDVVTETSGNGTDTIISTIDLTLAANVERLQLAGTSPLRGTGNALANVLIGNAAANRLDGGAGADAMSGGAGDDVYVVDSTADTVTELSGEGNDTVESSVTYRLAANVENLKLTGTAKIDATGNIFDNLLTGNSAVNALAGDVGNDRLDGGGGADAMSGGAGDDTYVVDNASDKTTEAAAGGIDTVESAIGWTLAAEVERLMITGTAVVNGTGNASANQIAGNDAANVLDGKAGVDVLLGAGGNDTLQDTNGTSASGNSAFDGGAGADVLKGTTSADLLAGGSGDDVLTPGGGTDVVCFNRGDGVDTVNAPLSGAGAGERNDTLSLGGVGFGQLQLTRDTSDLLVKVAGTADSLRIKSWYLGSANQTLNRLQIVVDSTADFAPGSGDLLRSSRLCVLDFVGLVNAFDAARAANPSLVNWTPTDTQFVAARINSSDSAAIGGNLAYRYAIDGTLAQVGYPSAVADLSSAGFGSTAQSISIGGGSATAARFAGDDGESESTLSAESTATSAAQDAAPIEAWNRRVGDTMVRISAEDADSMQAAGAELDFASVYGMAFGSADAWLLSRITAFGATTDDPVRTIVEADTNQRQAIDLAANGVAEAAPSPLRTALPRPQTIETTIAGPIVRGSTRDAAAGAELTLTPLDEFGRASFGEPARSATDTIRSPFMSTAVTAPSWPAPSDPVISALEEPFDASGDDKPGHVDLGVGTHSDLDRRIDRVAEAWFTPQRLSGDIALSHFDEVTRSVLKAQREDEDKRLSMEPSTSYARHWQGMRTRLGAFDTAGSDSGFGWDTGSAALARGGAPLGAAFNPTSLTMSATLRPNGGALPMFAGLQDGFERV